MAYPEAQPKTREVISCDHFLNAIADPDLELKIRECQPSDLDSALNIALQLEVWSAETERRREVQKLEKGEGRKIREISNEMPTPSTFQKKLEEMDAKMDAKLAEFEKRITATLNGTHGNFPRPPNQFSGCFQYGDSSHWTRDCPVFLAEQQGSLLQQFSSPKTSLQQPPQPPPQPDVRSMQDRSNKPGKTCIWVKYRPVSYTHLTLPTNREV